MTCPTCGNEVSQDEVFCGQCGAPNTMTIQASRANSLPPATRGNGLPPSASSANYNPTVAVPGPIETSFVGPAMPPGGSFVQRQPASFYHDATEAMILPPGAIPGQSYPPQPFVGTPPATNYMPQGQYMPALSALPLQRGQPYDQGYPVGTSQEPARRGGGALAVIITICLVVVLISIGGLGALYFKNQLAPTANNANTNATATVATTAAPTMAPTPTATPVPSPTTTATASVADNGFTLCDQTCTANGYLTEYPSNWQSKTISRSNGVQFSNPDQAGESATFKAPGQANGSQASDIALNDLQKNFSKKSGYNSDQTTATASIGGETWVTSTAYYQLNGQQERVLVYAVVHQGQSYIIELQAPDSQFDSVNSQYFTLMLGKFQFQQSAQ